MGQIIKHETAASLPWPGKCMDCGVNYGREFFIDTGMNAEWEGVIILCNVCIKSMVVAAFGFDPFARVDELDHKIHVILHDVETEIAEYTRLLRSLERVHIEPETIHAMALVEEEANGRRSSLDDSTDDDVRIADGLPSSDGEISGDDSGTSDGSTGDNPDESEDSTESSRVTFVID